MRMNRKVLRRRGRWVIASSLATVVLAGSLAWAVGTIPGTDGVIHGCYNNSKGALRVIDPTTDSCTDRERSIFWNQTGPPGPAGSPGPQGSPGPSGSDGAVANLDQLDGIPCNVGARREGVVRISYSSSGSISMVCEPSSFLLTVATTGTGSGSVQSVPEGINCGNGGTACTQSYVMDTQVTLSFSAASGSVFDGWSGACSGTGSCVVTMDAAKDVTARFVPTNQLFVTISGQGNQSFTPAAGTIAASINVTPPNTACDATYNGTSTSFSGACPNNLFYAEGTVVTLTVTFDDNSTHFSGWEGACTGTGTCTVTMSQDVTVRAVFAPGN